MSPGSGVKGRHIDYVVCSNSPYEKVSPYILEKEIVGGKATPILWIVNWLAGEGPLFRITWTKRPRILEKNAPGLGSR